MVNASKVFVVLIITAMLRVPISSAAEVLGGVVTPLSPVRQMAEALKARSGGDAAGAEARLQSLLSFPNSLHEYAHMYLAEIMQTQGRDKEAASQWQKILELSPNIRLQQEAQYQLGILYLKDKKFDRAKNLLSTLERRTRKESNYPAVIYALAQAESGVRNQGRFCKWIRKLYAKYPEYEKIKSWGLILQDNVFEGKKTNCLASREDYSSRIKSMQWAGMSSEAQNEIAELKKSNALPSEDLEKLEVLFNLHEGEISKALKVLTEHYEARRKSFSYLMTLATAAARGGEMQAAVGSYYEAYRVGGRSKLARQALYQAAFMSYQFQDYDGAYRRFQEFIRVFPTSGLSKDAKWHMAWIRYLRGDFDGAYQNFLSLKSAKTIVSKRRKRHKESSSVASDKINYWMAMALLRQKKIEEARSMFETMAKDHLLGYYSIAAQNRLKKMDKDFPQKNRGGAWAATRRILKNSRFEYLMPDEEAGYSPLVAELETEEVQAVTESEENESTVAASVEAAIEATETPAESDKAQEVVATEDAEVKTSFANPLLVRRFERARDLMSLGLNDWAKWDLYDIERKTSNREYLRTLITEYENVENYQRSSYIGQIYFGQQRAHLGIEGIRSLWESTYPKAYSTYVSKYSKLFEIPQELVWGIMRAESQYKKDIISPVGALGLMQVMPNTGMKISQIIGDRNFVSEKLLEPETAIKVGARYLARLMKKFDGSLALVAAGYNAGPHRVKSWIASFGDLDLDEFVEHIPFLETRNYVKKVLSNFYVYNQLYNSKRELFQSLAEPNKVHFYEPIATKETWEEN